MTDSLPISFGPYTAGPPKGRLIGAPIHQMERSRLFEATGARMRRMVGRDRVYVTEHTDFMVHTDADRRVVAVTATLVPPDQDLSDDMFRFTARREADGKEVPLAYTWALLLQIAHEVLGLAAKDAVGLLNGIYQDGYLPRDEGDVRLALVAGQRFERGDRALCLLAGLKGAEG